MLRLRRHLRLGLGLLLVGFWVACGLSGPVQAATPVPQEAVTLQSSWCQTSVELTVDELVQADCAWQPLLHGKTRGWDAHAHWMKLVLRNESPLHQERWLEVGQPQTANVTFYIHHPAGWEVHDVGMLAPLQSRALVGKAYGLAAVSLPPWSELTVRVRLQSDTVILLGAKAWEPEAFKARLQQRQFWSALGIGGLCLTLVFSLLMLALTRQQAYGFFALGTAGQFITLTTISGIFQRFFWPEGWTLTTTIRDFGALIAVVGLSRFLTAFLPQSDRHPRLLRAFRGAVYVSVAFVLSSLLGLARLDLVWFISVTLSGLLAMAICAQAWREGDRAAGIMVFAFGVFGALGALRLAVISGVINFVPELTQAPFLGIFLGTPVVLLGLVDRTRQLQDELSRLQAESAAQLRFLAQMSHELRSPLDNILGHAQLLAREARSGAQIGGLNSIFDSGRQLLRLIDHILDYARGSAGMLRVEPAPLHLGTFLRGMERMARVLAVQRNNQFDLVMDGEPDAMRALTVMADGERMRQVLGNLLANAARHTHDGVITLQIRSRPLDASGIRLDFSVKDSGEGISAQEQHRIFHPFERAESQASSQGKGAGLGLAIARQLAELMGGRLSVQSAPGQGSSFRFSLPLRQLPAQQTLHPERLEGFDAAGYLGPRRTVLVVDDEAAGRAVLCQLLESLGFEVLSANSGSAALALLPGLARLDLVLTDQYMPDGDGWLVLEGVAACLPEVPVVLISAAPSVPPSPWNSPLRFAAQFLRPIDHALLLARLGDLLDLQWSDSAVAHEPLSGGATPQQALAVTATESLGPVRRPPSEQLQGLAQLVELGQVTAIQQWARRLQSEQPEYARYATCLLDAVRSLDLPTLLDLVSDAGPNEPAANSAAPLRLP